MQRETVSARGKVGKGRVKVIQCKGGGEKKKHTHLKSEIEQLNYTNVKM